jgi:hypothetical protein
MVAVIPIASTAAAKPRRRSRVRASRGADVTIPLALLRYLILKISIQYTPK